MSYIFRRNGLYLSQFYKWTPVPCLFPEWQVTTGMFGLLKGWRDAPQEFAIVAGGGVVDLDAVTWDEF